VFSPVRADTLLLEGVLERGVLEITENPAEDKTAGRSLLIDEIGFEAVLFVVLVREFPVVISEVTAGVLLSEAVVP
jgi:hypothetical protein